MNNCGRVMARDGLSELQARQRIAAQLIDGRESPSRELRDLDRRGDG